MTDPFDVAMAGPRRGSHVPPAAGEPALVQLRVEPEQAGCYARFWAYRPGVPDAVLERDMWWGQHDFELLAGDLVKLVLVEYDAERETHVNQNWTWWQATGVATDLTAFNASACQADVSGAVAAAVDLVCTDDDCDLRWPMAPVTPDACSVHEAELTVEVSIL